MREFAEGEIILPTGPYAGRRFRCDRQPFARLWFDSIDGGIWKKHAATGPQQTGKSLMCLVIPLMYHLFEIRETVILGIPNLDMVSDKWNLDILPVIEKSRYRDLLPTHGAGSRGGDVKAAIQFRHGPTLRFMTGGGGDKTRASFTSRVLLTTETDGMDEAGGSSREADKVTQLEGRTRAYGDRARIYHECTVSTEAGRIWQEYKNGTQSRIAIRCQHCRAYVTPERENLIGWKEAENVMEAGSKSAFSCPSCGAVWSEDDRRDANRDCLLLHKGQSLSDDSVTGDMPKTDTLGFRWTATNNLLVTTAVLGMDEWKASHAVDEENAEKAQRQFVWALPHKPSKEDLTALTAHGIAAKTNKNPRGFVPAGCNFVTVGIDLGKWLCHWTALAWGPHATPYAIDYGTFNVPSKDMAIESALLAALRDFRDSTLKDGWKTPTEQMRAAHVFIDAGYFPMVASQFAEESGEGFYHTKGVGSTQAQRRSDRRETGSKVVAVGDHYCGVSVVGCPVMEIEIDADHWKSFLHSRIAAPVGSNGSLTLYDGRDHLGFAKQLTAEKKTQEFVPGKGLVTRWEQIHNGNHFLDSTTLACVAGHVAGARLFEPTKESAPTAPAEQSDWSPSYRRW